MSRERAFEFIHQQAKEKGADRGTRYSALIEKETTLLADLDGKAGQVAEALTLVTSLSIAPAMIEQMKPTEKANLPETERIENKQERVAAFLDRLLNLPDYPQAASAEQNEMMKRTAARVIIQEYALGRKGLANGRADLQDVGEGAMELLEGAASYIDRSSGEKDGALAADGMNRFNKFQQENTGMRALYEMMERTH